MQGDLTWRGQGSWGPCRCPAAGEASFRARCREFWADGELGSVLVLLDFTGLRAMFPSVRVKRLSCFCDLGVGVVNTPYVAVLGWRHGTSGEPGTTLLPLSCRGNVVESLGVCRHGSSRCSHRFAFLSCDKQADQGPAVSSWRLGEPRHLQGGCRLHCGRGRCSLWLERHHPSLRGCQMCLGSSFCSLLHLDGVLLLARSG